MIPLVRPVLLNRRPVQSPHGVNHSAAAQLTRYRSGVSFPAMQHPLFPYLLGALVCLGFVGLAFAVSSALAFRDEVRAWQASAEARAVREHEKLEDRVGVVEQLGHARDLALERQASELVQHRLSLPPPRVFSSGPRRHMQTSEDWDDGDGRKTEVRPSQPPPLPAFERPAYMAR